MTQSATSVLVNAQPGLGPPVVTCQRLVKTYKDFWMRDRAYAVDDVTFDIRQHEVFGLLGPNGSGKSTTIKLILGLLRPTRGRVAVFGKPASDVAIKRRIGYLPEESYLYPFLNARETLEYYGKLFEIDYKTRERRMDELLDMVGLANAQFRQVREYSKGMQRRIGIAQALINDPEFLILDEPTTGLDPIGTRQIKDLIIHLGRRGKTVLLSSHLLSDVEDCVDRMVILYGGKIRAEGTCDSLLTTQNKTSLETDALDDETISEIDRVIRARSGGESSLLKVSKPRQSLESLFLEIVERARATQTQTSGATSGGEMAAFLKSEEGAALIDKLVAAQGGTGAAGRNEPAPAEPVRPSGPDTSVIGDLLAGKKAEPAAAPMPPKASSPAAPPPPPPAAAGPASNVDAGLIGSLLKGKGGENEGGGA